MNFLNAMIQQKWSNLIKVSIEHELCGNLDYENMHFAKTKF